MPCECYAVRDDRESLVSVGFCRTFVDKRRTTTGDGNYTGPAGRGRFLSSAEEKKTNNNNHNNNNAIIFL